MIQSDKLDLGAGGNYSGSVGVRVSADGLELELGDTVNAWMTLTALLGTVAQHSIASHSDMGTDFAPQYYNTARLTNALADAVLGNTVAVSGDVGGNTTLGDHVADPDIHQRVPKYVLRVAKGGQAYPTISSALSAIPTSGPEAPAPDRWYRIEVSPGTYYESVLVDKQWVEIVGSGAESTRLEWNNSVTLGTWALYINASNVLVKDLLIRTTNPTVAHNTAVMVGDPSTVVASYTNVMFERVTVASPGAYALWLSGNFSDGQIRHSRFEAAKEPVMQAGGACRYYWTNFSPGSSLYSSVHMTGGQGLFIGCFGPSLLYLENAATADVLNCSGGGVIATGTGDVIWDGLGYLGTFTDNAPLPIYKAEESDFFSTKNFELLWGPSNSNLDLPRRQFKAGHHSNAVVTPGIYFGDDGPDFRFYRKVDIASTMVGDVMAIGDDSSGVPYGVHPDGNIASALALYLGGNNDSGKYLRLIDGDYESGSEIGYIDRAGVMHMPGYQGDGSLLTGVPVGSHVHPIAQITNLQTTLDGKQAAHAQLTALAGLATTGLIARSDANTVAARTITAGAGVSVTNGNGVSDNPTIAINAAVVPQWGVHTGVSGNNTVPTNVSFLSINLNIGSHVMILPTATAPIGKEYWASVINIHGAGTNTLTWDAGGGFTIHAPGVFSQTYALSGAQSNTAHRWFKIVKMSATVWSIDTGVPA